MLPLHHHPLKTFIKLLKFVIPFGIWIFLFKKIFLGISFPDGDGFSSYVYVRYFVNNLLLGVFPLWNPFLSLGLSQLFFNSFMGVHNPLWIFTALLTLIGMKIYYAYLVSIVLYFFIGTLGFYLLAKTYLNQEHSAYVAFLLLLFSSFGMPFFCSLKDLLIFVPIIWFFYFCLIFSKNQKTFALIGITLTFMISISCYLPPYWLTIISIVLVLTLFFFPKTLFSVIQTGWNFTRKKKTIILACALAAITACILSLNTLSLSQNQEIAFTCRSGETNALSQKGIAVLERRMQSLMSSMEFFYNENLRISPGHLSHQYESPFYISIFALLTIMLGSFNKLRKVIFSKFLFCLIMFFIIAVPQGPIFKFLFHHLWGFRLIQFLRSFMPALVMGLILLAVDQGKEIVEKKFSLDQKIGIVIIILIHSCGLYYLLRYSNPSFSSYATILASALFFSLVVSEKKGILVSVLLYIAILIQPLEALYLYGQGLKTSSSELKEAALQDLAKPAFSYCRPNAKAESLYNVYQKFWQYDMAMRDAPARIRRDYPSWWTYSLFQDFPIPLLEKYGSYKFYLYNKVFFCQTEDRELMSRILDNKTNIAMAYANPKEKEALFDIKEFLVTDTKNASQGAEIIEGPSNDFRIVNFTVNSLEIVTHFKEKKFLVYTDSYQTDWQVYINQKRRNIYRANGAFKGIVVPPGFCKITFRYAPLGGEKTYFLALMIYNGMLLWLLFLAFKEYTQNSHFHIKNKHEQN